MSNLTISNLDEARELDAGASEAVRGGLQVPGLGELYGVSNLLAQLTSATVSQNAVNLIMSGSQGSGDTTNYLGNATITPVNLSPVTVVQGSLPAA